MSEAPFTFVQDVFKAPHPPIEVTTRQYSGLSRKVLQAFLKTADDGVVGVAPAYGSKCVLSVVAFASSTTILVVRFPKNLKNGKRPGPSTAGKDLQDLILCADSHSKVAFQMDVLATSLYHDLDLRISGAVDLLSVAEDHRHSLGAIMNSIGGVVNLNRPKVIGLFKGEEQWNKISVHDVALQAWVAWRAGTLEKMGPRLKKLPRIDTGAFSEARLSAFSKMVRDACRLSAAKPTRIKNEIASDFTIKKDRLHLTCTRFKTRVRREQSLEIQRGRQTTVSGRSTQVKGRAAQIQLSSALPAGPITVTTVGKEPPTFAEVRRTEIILTALQRRSSIAEQPFFQAIWSPLETPRWPTGPSVSRSAPINFQRPLNDSQVRGVEAILSTEPIVVIHGPPGTGKTTVIAAAVRNISQNRTMFLSAQSNVAVKNIAEKLASVDFLDFKILVSEEFHYDWHEHLYEKINPNLIRSDQFVDDIVATERQLLGSKVILCTLSMLSSPGISTIIRLVPPQTIIVDEASQVEIGNYLSVISRFSKSLRKLVFIGDDKQLAPYGQNDIDNLQSVFEIAHLREGAIFLDTQYRMPIQLGTFIGRHVYDDKLKSEHRNTAPCCQFIDVSKGKEVKKGLSWINTAEINAVMAQARQCHTKGRSYRIITPYDAQRGMLEKALKASKIPWEDKVFCVDSFQGNEDDYIIVSIVRTDKIGFLAEKRRVNVMLSRCKKGLRLCVNRAFLEGAAKDSLVGLLASEIGESAWV